jgi:hypothetical protein
MNANSTPIFSVGQKVICINDSFPGAVADWCDFLPIAGHIYTIRGMQIGRNRVTGFSNLGFLLAEITNPPSSLGREAGFCHYRFVPWLETYSESEHNNAVEPAQLQESSLV